MEHLSKGDSVHRALFRNEAEAAESRGRIGGEEMRIESHRQ